MRRWKLFRLLPAIIMMVFHTSVSFQHFHENVSLLEGLFNNETNHTVNYTILNYGSLRSKVQFKLKSFEDLHAMYEFCIGEGSENKPFPYVRAALIFLFASLYR